jgi:hypothetical protein
VLLVLKDILDLNLMTDIALYFPLEFIGDWIFLHCSAENSELPLEDLGIISHFGNDAAYLTDVIGQDNRAENLNESNDNCFTIIDRRNVTKTNGQHDGTGPVIAPKIENIPCLSGLEEIVIDQFHKYPIVLSIDFGSSKKGSRYDMSKYDIEDNNSNEVPDIELLH